MHKMVWQKMVGTRVGYATTLLWKCSTPLFSVRRQGLNCSACQTAALDRITALQREIVRQQDRTRAQKVGVCVSQCCNDIQRKSKYI